MSPLKLQLQSLDLTYDMAFRKPAFDLAPNSLRLLQRLYEALSPRVMVSPADLQVGAGNSLGDVLVRLRLFRGQGLVEITVDRFKCRFTELTAEEHLQLVVSCIDLAEKGVQEALTDVSAGTTAFRTVSWWKADVGKDKVKAYLRGAAEGRLQIPTQALGATEEEYSFKGTFRNKEENWLASFVLEPSVAESSDIFFSFDTVYIEDGKYTLFTAQAEHYESLCRAFLRGIGCELPNEGRSSSEQA